MEAKWRRQIHFKKIVFFIEIIFIQIIEDMIIDLLLLFLFFLKMLTYLTDLIILSMLLI